MLRKNKIFLSLLGSFYDDTAYTDFSSRLDYIYTSIIFNSYVSTLRATVLAVDSSAIPNSVHFGFINTADIDISSNKIVVRDINGEEVNGVDFMSLMYLDIEKFYEVNNNIVSQEAISALSGYSTPQIPIVYMIDVSRDIFRNGIFRFVDNMSKLDVSKVRDASLRIVSDQIAYYPETLKLLLKLSNILLGSVYSRSFETVLYTDNDVVITTKNQYNLSGVNSGRSVVSVGQELRPSELITAIATLSTDIAFIDDVTKMMSYINSVAPSFSNTVFLTKLSSAIAKKKAAIIIPPDVFAETETEVISAINAVFRLSSSVDTHTTSGLFDSANVDGKVASGWLIAYSANIDVQMSGLWDLTIVADDFIVSGDVTESLIINEDSPVFITDDFFLGLEPVLDYTTVEYSNTAIYRIDAKSSTEWSESDYPYGEYVDTNIVEVDEHSNDMMAAQDNISIVDDGPVFTDASVTYKENLSINDSDIRTISARAASEILIGDIMSTISSRIDSISPIDYLSGYSEIIDYGEVSYTEAYSTMMADNSSAYVTEDDVGNSVSIGFFDILSIEDSTYSIGVKVDKADVEFTFDEDVLYQVKEATLIEDFSDIESENNIDS